MILLENGTDTWIEGMGWGNRKLLSTIVSSLALLEFKIINSYINNFFNKMNFLLKTIKL